MARTIAVTLDGVESSFTLTAIDRAAIYGRRRRVALDRLGEPCTRASLLDDGSLLLRSGMTGQGYFLPDGTVLKLGDLEAFDPNGAALPKMPSTLGVPQALEGPVAAAELLNVRVESIYGLDPADVSESLLAFLAAGNVYRFPFTFRDDFRRSVGFLLANDEGVFALIGTPMAYEWSTLQVTAELPSTDDDDGDDLDFEMF